MTVLNWRDRPILSLQLLWRSLIRRADRLTHAALDRVHNACTNEDYIIPATSRLIRRRITVFVRSSSNSSNRSIQQQRQKTSQHRSPQA